MKHTRSGLKLPPGNAIGDLLTWDGVRYKPMQPALPLPVPPGPGSVVNNSYITYVNGGAVPSSLLVPLTLGCLGRYEADFGIGVADGAPVPLWSPADPAGAGFPLAATGTIVPPTFHSQDNGDNIPYVGFPGVASMLRVAGLAYAGTDLTVYMVARAKQNVNNKFLWSLGRAGVVPGVAAGTASARWTQHRYDYLLGGGSAGDGTQEVTGFMDQVGTWATYAFRVGTFGGRIYTNYWRSGLSGWGVDITAAAFVFNVDRMGIGGDCEGINGGDFSNVDIRHFSIYETAHRDDQVRYMGAYLSRYGQPPLI